MASRRYGPSEASDRYESRRDYGRSEVGRRDERIWEEELEYRSRPTPPPRERARATTIIKEDVRVKERSPPDFLREDYGRTTSGPVVLRAREREDFEFVPRPRRRSPSPDIERKIEREEIIVRKEPEIRREPLPPPRDYDREEIVIRRDREPERVRPPPPREIERDEIIVRRDERGGTQRYSSVYDRDEMLERRAPPRDDYEREEIIIRRDRDDSRDPPRYRGRDDPYALPRAVSHERERSRMGRSRAGSDTDEIIIRRDEREVGRNGREREREEIIIRRHDSRSPSPASTRAPSVRPPPEPQVINAPAIHQEVITHHRHIDHGYELALAPIAPPEPRPRPPSPPTPPREEEERIEIRRRGERNGKAYDEDIIIDRNQSRSAPPSRDRRDDDFDHPPYYNSPAPLRRPAPPAERWRDPRDSRDLQEEAEHYNQRALERSYPGEGYHGSTVDWAIVDVPPGTRRVRMDGAGGGAQEITWQRYNGVRRSKFMPDGSDEGYGSEVGRPVPVPAPAPASALAPAVAAGGEIGRRYAGAKDPREAMWTEITKDLVVKEAITEAGYEFEETDDFFYVIAYLKYVSIFSIASV